MQLRFASLVVINLWQDFHLQVCAHAGRTGMAGMSRWLNPALRYLHDPLNEWINTR